MSRKDVTESVDNIGVEIEFHPPIFIGWNPISLAKRMKEKDDILASEKSESGLTKGSFVSIILSFISIGVNSFLDHNSGGQAILRISNRFSTWLNAELEVSILILIFASFIVSLNRLNIIRIFYRWIYDGGSCVLLEGWWSSSSDEKSSSSTIHATKV